LFHKLPLTAAKPADKQTDVGTLCRLMLDPAGQAVETFARAPPRWLVLLSIRCCGKHLSHVFESAEIVLMYQSKKIRSHRTVEKGRLDSMTPLYSHISKCYYLDNSSRVGVYSTAGSECDRCSYQGFLLGKGTQRVLLCQRLTAVRCRRKTWASDWV
jgi:hypothetical protein